MVLTYWLSTGSLDNHYQLIRRMRDVCLSILDTGPAPTISNKTRDLIDRIDEAVCQTQCLPRMTLLIQCAQITTDNMRSPIPLSPGRRIPRTSDILPHDLAIAMTLLEGDRYRALHPSDYMAYLKRPPGPNNVDAVCLTNNKIILWVQQSILHYNLLHHRVEVLKFFVNAAQVG